MVHLRLSVARPEGYPLYIQSQGKRLYFSEDESIELDVQSGESVTLAQDGAMTKLKKVLAAIFIFLTAPLQLAYLYYSRDGLWASVDPFRVQATLKVLEEANCKITITKGETALQHPRLVLSGQGAVLTELCWKACPWVYGDACYVYLCRVISGASWLLALMAYLFTVGVTQQNYFAMVTTGAVSVGTIAVTAYLAVHACRECRQYRARLDAK